MIIFIISGCLFSTNGYGGRKMEYLYDIKEATELKPQGFEATGGLLGTKLFGGYENIYLFPLPQANSVGSTQMGNAITQISFPGKRISFDRHFKNAVEDMDAGEVFLPVVSKDVIGIGLPRKFLLFDFKKKIHREFKITPSISETIAKAVIVDARKNLFLFEISGHSGNSPNPWDISSSLMLMDLNGTEPKVVKEIPVARYFQWYVVGDKNFLYRYKTQQLQVFNMNMEPAQHPLADAINTHKDKISFLRVSAHPSLPFALLWGGKYDEVIISWGTNRLKSPVSFLGKKITAANFLFSPDGKWVVFEVEGEPDYSTKKTYVMPVSEKYPHYLGSPILIVNTYFNDNKYAWTNNPVSFVGSSDTDIFRCDLENRDFPGKDKMSFHDYIVQEDLKKLAKEKRQGLGK
ncbi:MAG: hypothetical protein EHM79_09410 [Geobacter sp.]|nr:MAG: hypothetical protein EHM79_09410 [Geobacter sp.]